jgi:hypothetical protein
MEPTSITRQSLARLTPDQRNTLPNQVADRLFAIAGEEVFGVGFDPYDSALLERGRLFDQERQLRMGRPGGDFGNVARLWAEDPARYAFVTGYALSDSVWLPHSWLVAGTTLIETTTLAEVYYGFELPEEEAVLGWLRVTSHPTWPDTARPPAKLRPLLLKHKERLAQVLCSCCLDDLIDPPRHEHVRGDHDGGTRPRSRSTR